MMAHKPQICGQFELIKSKRIDNVTVKLGVGLYQELLKQDLDYCISNFQVLELQDFVMPDNLENPLIVRDYRGLLNGFAGEITLHGPYLNLVPTSLDRRVRELAVFRYMQSIDIANEMGASRVIIHSYYDPKPGFLGYDDMWLEDNMIFWSSFLEKIEGLGISILLENCHDQNPATFARLIAEVNHPCFSSCLDIGHSSCLSSAKPELWIAENRGSYFHITDNDGSNDSHLLMGRGNIDFTSIAREFSRLANICLISEAKAAFYEQLASLIKLREMIEAYPPGQESGKGINVNCHNQW